MLVTRLPDGSSSDFALGAWDDRLTRIGWQVFKKMEKAQMLLLDKTTVIFGGGGSMGGADDIRRSGGTVETATVDAHDSEADLARVVNTAGPLDIGMNTVHPNDVQGIALVEMSLPDFLTPVTESARTNFC